jgi:formylglycine-generating enzyme required for sulfatase activity
MLGNVREWLEDPYYEGGVARTLIGSSWRSGDALGGREQGGEIESGADIGIRVARER